VFGMALSVMRDRINCSADFLWKFFLPQLEKLVLYSDDIIFSFDGIEKALNLKTLVLDSTELFSLHGLGNAFALQVHYWKKMGS